MRILVVEDDDSIATSVEDGLVGAGFEVTRARTGGEALDAAPADVVLLDLGLPDMDGFEVCRRLRARTTVPIIVISARSDEVDRVVGLELGADDYLVKPFGLRELIARVRAVLRRSSTEPAPAVRIGEVDVDVRARRVSVGDREIELTRKEFDLLALLASDPGAVFSRDAILEQVWDAHWYGPTKTLDVHIASLRRKLGDPTLIETVRGVGFRVRAPNR